MDSAIFLWVALFIIKAIQYPVMVKMWHSTSRPSRRTTIAWVLVMSMASDLILLGCVLFRL